MKQTRMAMKGCSMTEWGRIWRGASASGVVCSALLLGACALPERAPAPVRFDFGPVLVASEQPAQRTGLALRVQAAPALESTAMLYRLAYADAHQLRVYAQSRWTMTPADLLQQRLRARLSAQYWVPPMGEPAALTLHLEVEEFTQVYDSAKQSQGVLRARATLMQRSGGQDAVISQRDFLLQRESTTPDAAGGVQALALATDALADALLAWTQQNKR
jgi:cholesterol transport system auxiliary component